MPARAVPALLLLAIVCGSPRAGADLAPVETSNLPELVDDADVASLLTALDRSVAALSRRPPDAGVPFGARTCTAGSVRASLDRFAARVRAGGAPDEAAREIFTPYRSDGRDGGPLVTGYYEPVVSGRKQPGGAFVHPLYRRPPDLVEIELPAGASDNGRVSGRIVDGELFPYYSRREIDGRGILGGRGLELVWLDDPIERFFLHVQGSGVVDLGDGNRLRVGYAGSNGRPYTSIGRLLRDAGFLEAGETTAPAIRRWLRANPALADEVLYANERYIFFRAAPEGPFGSLGVALTPGRSAAADASRYAPGALAYLDTRVPVVDPESGQRTGYRALRRFIVLQDTGAAITGPGRLDLFFGTGRLPGLEAGHMAEPATLYLFVPRGC